MIIKSSEALALHKITSDIDYRAYVNYQMELLRNLWTPKIQIKMKELGFVTCTFNTQVQSALKEENPFVARLAKDLVDQINVLNKMRDFFEKKPIQDDNELEVDDDFGLAAQMAMKIWDIAHAMTNIQYNYFTNQSTLEKMQEDIDIYYETLKIWKTGVPLIMARLSV